MSNDHGKPPVNTSETSKLQGIPVSRVDLLGLQSIVRKMKARSSNYGDMTIAKEINETILKDSEIKLSAMAVNRWWAKNKDKENDGDMVNIYGNHLEILESLNKQLGILDTYLDEMNSKTETMADVLANAKVTKELMLTHEKLSMRKQAILGTIGDIHEKVCTYVNMTTVVDRILTKVMDKDHGLYLEITEEIKNDPLLAELFRKIKPEK